jgi:hypothetical protein
MGVVEKRIFTQGIDSDTTPELTGEGRYLSAKNMNVVVSDGNNYGTAEVALGNTPYTITLPAGDNKCVGTYEDKTSHHLYYFNYNSLGQHGIYRVESGVSTAETVLVDSLLNFNKSYLITGIDIAYIDLDRPILGWTDGGAPNTEPTIIYNPPRQLDVNKAIAYTNGDFVNGYPAITVEVLDQIKYPPQFSPTVQFLDDQTYAKNNLRGRLTQYKYRYVYKDFSKSAWSPISDVVNPNHAQIIDNVTYLPFYFDNRIDITLIAGSSECVSIELAVRQLNSTPPDFYLVDTLDNVNQVYSFFYDRVLLPIEINDSNKLYDDVPRVAKAETILAGNRKAWANVVNQFDLPQPDVALVNIEQRLPDPLAFLGTLPASQQVLWVQQIPPPFAPQLYAQLVTIPNPFPYPAGSVLQLSSDVNITYIVSQADIDSIQTFRNNLVTALQAQLPNNTYSVAQSDGYYITSPPTTYNLAQPNQFFVWGANAQFDPVPSLTFNVYSFESGYSNWLSGFNKTFGLVYYDRANRSTSVITDNNFNIQVPAVANSAGLYLKRNFIGWEINHKPPIYATHYQWVARYSAPSFIDFSIQGIANVGTQTEINLTPIIDYSNKFPSSILSYAYTSGDRCQFLTTVTGVPQTTFIDVAVNAFDEGTNILKVDQVDFNTLVITVGSLIRIYTPQPNFTDEEAVFYEFSQQFEVGDAGLPSRYHKGQTQDQTNTLPATGIFDRGDVWIRPRRMSTTNATTFSNYWVESPDFSDFYQSKVWDKGRPNVFNKDFRETRRPTTTFYSQPFIPETNVNGLGSVFPENFASDDIRVLLAYGSIQKLYAEGVQLYVFQEIKTGVVRVNERVAFDAGTNNIIGATDQVLNPINYFAGDYGIGQHPESFGWYGYAKYHVDVRRGVVLRLSADGYTPISSIYKVNNFTTDKFAEIFSAGQKINIYGAYNTRFNRYEYSVEETELKDRTVIRGYTYAFTEQSNTWTSFYDYLPDFMGTLGQELITFKDGIPYLHNSGTNYANYYGAQFHGELQVVFNQQPSESKLYNTVAIEGTDAWDIPLITVFDGSAYQESSLLSTDFDLYEGKYRAWFLMDALTPNVVNPLIDGDYLRGRYVILNLLSPLNKYARIFALDVNTIPSAISRL